MKIWTVFFFPSLFDFKFRVMRQNTKKTLLFLVIE